MIALRLRHPSNAQPMLVTLSGIVTLVRLVQPMNAASPMLVTLLGIVTLARLVHDKNAKAPMLVTGRPLIVLGMVTAPPGPVYPVMVMLPLLVVSQCRHSFEIVEIPWRVRDKYNVVPDASSQPPLLADDSIDLNIRSAKVCSPLRLCSPCRPT